MKEPEKFTLLKESKVFFSSLKPFNI